MKAYNTTYEAFAKMHGSHTEHSEMVNDIGHKQIAFEDGAVWYERYERVIETKEVEAHGIKFEIEVELLKIEYWSTDNATSKYAYDRW